MTKKSFFVCVSLFWTVVQAALAAPTLRLTIPDSLRLQSGEVRPVWISSGTNGPNDLLLEAWNAGDGNLNLQVNGGPSAWLKPSVSGTQPCSSNSAITCTLIRVLFESASLQNGVYEGDVWVQDTNALDAPQSVPIRIYVGGNVPQRVDLYLRPADGSTDSIEFDTPEGPAPSVSLPAGNFLSVSSSGLGSFKFLHNHKVTAAFRSGMPVGQSSYTLTVAGSTFPPDNRAVPVNLNVTNDPIAQPSATTLHFQTARQIAAPNQILVVSNRGSGTLAISGVEATTASGGGWLSVTESQTLLVPPGQPGQSAGTKTYVVSAQQEGLAAGRYMGTIRIASNAANGPLELPVIFDVSEQVPPQITYRGAVNGATFSQLQPLAPGAIVSVFGSQLAYDTAQATSVPLPTELASAKVTIGGIDAPLFFVSRGQINFQVPNELPQGATNVQVTRGGQAGNRITAVISERTSGIFRLNIGEYGAIVNASASERERKTIFPIPRDLAAAVGIDGAPARPGDVLTIFATGLGPVTPGVPTGEAAPPQGPVSYGVDQPTVNFGRPIPIVQPPLFAGLAPGFVGLYQVNVAIPETLRTNARTAVTIVYPGGGTSNTVEIAVEQ
jgi:uncharacterized protein (TIGR03437 family)